MRDFEGAVTIATSPDRLFNYLADVRHLPDYFPKALSAKAGDGDDLAIVLDLGGEPIEMHAWFRADEAHRMLQWGVPDAGYQGWIAVTPSPIGCELAVSVQKPDDDEIANAEIRDTIHSIRNIMRRPS
jgi:polyketide cyclase/dehydrase/lipid transport protein